MDENNIFNIVRTAHDNFTTGKTAIGKYVDWSLHENIEKIDAYANSKHISGETDSMDREKPFFNITTAAENVWYKATDIDRKDIKIKPNKEKDTIGAMLLNIHLQEYMNKENFGMFLNKWGRTLARYCSAVVKFVKKEDALHINVIPWNRLIVDSVDFYNNPIIERLFYTPSQLRHNKSYNQTIVKNLLDAVSTRKTMDNQQVDRNSDYIELYEVHGEFPLSYLTGKEKDSEEYVQQMHVISYVGDGKGKFDDFTLVSGREKQNPYMLTHLLEEDGRIMGIGAIERLFEAQWMVNHSAKAIKDQLDLASKLIFQTSDGSFVGQNVLEAIETGDIMIHQANQPLTQVANNSHDITSLQNYAQQWKDLAQEITSTPDAITGSTMPSGTAYRQVAILNQEIHNFFDMMLESKGLYLEQMLREYIIPYLKTKFDTSEEITTTLDYDGLNKIDAKYIKAEANRMINQYNINQALAGQIAEPVDEGQIQNQVQNMLQEQGNQRFIRPSEVKDKTWNDIFKDIETTLKVEITNEGSDKAERLATISELLQTITKAPQILQDPNGRMFFNKILEESSIISPLQLNYANNAQPIQNTPIGGK